MNKKTKKKAMDYEVISFVQYNYMGTIDGWAEIFQTRNSQENMAALYRTMEHKTKNPKFLLW
mgnify:CR=1 FL=1